MFGRRYDNRVDLTVPACRMERSTLARIMVEPTWQSTDIHVDAIGRLLDAAKAEGVAGLVNWRLDGAPSVDPTLREAFARAARGIAAASLLFEAECRKVIGVLEAGGVEGLLLKGSALAYWLYPQPFLRECSDIDLLLPSRAAAEQAAALLAPHGYALSHAPGDQGMEFLLSRRAFPGAVRVDLDVHWQLVNAAMFADVFDFDELHAASIPLPASAPSARGLSPVHALLHACMHRAMNLYTGIGDRLKWLYDIHLLAQRLTAVEWQDVQGLCAQRGLGGVCLAGIDAAAELFGEAAPQGVLDVLRAQSADEPLDVARLHDWKYMERRNFAALPNLRGRARWLWQRTFPSQGYLQELYGGGQGRTALLWRRCRRLLLRLSS